MKLTGFNAEQIRAAFAAYNAGKPPEQTFVFGNKGANQHVCIIELFYGPMHDRIGTLIAAQKQDWDNLKHLVYHIFMQNTDGTVVIFGRKFTDFGAFLCEHQYLYTYLSRRVDTINRHQKSPYHALPEIAFVENGISDT